MLPDGLPGRARLEDKFARLTDSIESLQAQIREIGGAL
jgi:hypothetical protein